MDEIICIALEQVNEKVDDELNNDFNPEIYVNEQELIDDYFSEEL